ncbi:MAG: SH3 domain-containing protein, partial [Chloroflexota bacterium]
MNKYINLNILLLLLLLLGACSFTETPAEETVVEETLNIETWPTPIPTAAPVEPTPFPKGSLPPTPAPVENETGTSSESADTTDEESLLNSDGETSLNVVVDPQTYLSTISSQIGPIGGLSPVAMSITAQENVNLRQGPGAGYGVENTLARSELVAILGTDASKSWAYTVNSSLETGWIALENLRVTGSLDDAPVLPPDPLAALAEEFLSSFGAGGTASTSSDEPATPEITLDEVEATTSATVTIEGLNLRQGPSAEYGRLGGLSKDEEVAILGVNRTEEWALIETASGDRAWASLDHLVPNDSLENAPVIRSVTPDQAIAEGEIAPIITIDGAVAGDSSGAQVTAASSGAPSTPSVSAQSSLVPPDLATITSGQVSQTLDLRRGPGDSYGFMKELIVGETLSILAVDESQTWALVDTTNDGIGWVSIDNIS